MLVTLIASHLSSEQRVQSLRRAIASGLCETDEVWVSVSWADEIELPWFADDPRLRLFSRAFGRCSQTVHWMMLAHALRGAGGHNDVVLLDDDDYFNEGARAVFEIGLKKYRGNPASMACDVSGTVMGAAEFVDMLDRFAASGEDPTNPMADAVLFRTVVQDYHTDVVTRKPFDPDDSAWSDVAIKYGRRVPRGY